MSQKSRNSQRTEEEMTNSLFPLCLHCLVRSFIVHFKDASLLEPRKLEKGIARVNRQKYMCLFAALGLFIAHFIHFVYAHSVAGKQSGFMIVPIVSCKNMRFIDDII